VPGIGKTALLEYAASGAQRTRVLRARRVESEAEVPFAGLSELLRPAVPALDRIPRPQANALAGALALAPATGHDRFAIGAATLSLLSAFAEELPAVLIDDAHLLDDSSADAGRFAARRLFADPISLVLTVREGERSLLDGAGLRQLHVAGLTRSDAAELLERARVPDEAMERRYRATGGKPLALVLSTRPPHPSVRFALSGGLDSDRMRDPQRARQAGRATTRQIALRFAT
jgi:hypothetical protein